MKVWTCQRQSGGVTCRHKNPSRKQKCEACGKPKRPRRQPKHMDALEFSYADYVELNGGEHCAICGAKPSGVRRLCRDHDHTTGRPRGILCVRCNRNLPVWVTPEWLYSAATYLETAGWP